MSEHCRKTIEIMVILSPMITYKYHIAKLLYRKCRRYRMCDCVLPSTTFLTINSMNIQLFSVSVINFIPSQCGCIVIIFLSPHLSICGSTCTLFLQAIFLPHSLSLCLCLSHTQTLPLYLFLFSSGVGISNHSLLCRITHNAFEFCFDIEVPFGFPAAKCFPHGILSSHTNGQPFFTSNIFKFRSFNLSNFLGIHAYASSFCIISIPKLSYGRGKVLDEIIEPTHFIHNRQFMGNIVYHLVSCPIKWD